MLHTSPPERQSKSSPNASPRTTLVSPGGAPIAKPTADEIRAGVQELRDYLLTRFGSKQAAFKALDTNGNGNLGIGELKDSCDRLRIDLPQITNVKDFKTIFYALVPVVGQELDVQTLFDKDPLIQEKSVKITGMHSMPNRVAGSVMGPTSPLSPSSPSTLPKRITTSKSEPAGKRPTNKTSMSVPVETEAIPQPATMAETVRLLRENLVKKFGTAQAAFKAMDTNGNGLLSRSEIQDSFGRMKIKLESLCGTSDMRRVYQYLDVDKQGELSFWELMVSDPDEERAKVEAERARLAAERAKAKAEEAARIAQEEAKKAAAEEAAKKSFLELEAGGLTEVSLADIAAQLDLQPYQQLRNFLIARFGSAKAAFRSLDTNGNGQLSFGEIRQSLERLHIDLRREISNDFDLRAVFKFLDVDSSGELTFFELFLSDPETERAKLRVEKKAALQALKAERELQDAMGSSIEDELPEETQVFDEVELFRNYLVKKFGSKEAAFEMLDYDGSGLLSFGEMRVALERHGISIKEAINENANLFKLFRRLDANARGELSFKQLMVNRPGTKDRRKRKKSMLQQEDAVEFRDVHEEDMSEWLQRIMEFVRMTNLSELNLRWGHVGKDGAHRLAAGLEAKNKVRKVKLLQLEGNYMTAVGLRPLLAAIDNFCSVERLILSWNAIDNTAMKRLGVTITKVNTLVELDLSHNHISDHGAEQLARVIGNPGLKIGLKKLDLQHNLMGRFGIDEIRYACGSRIKFKFHGNTPESTAGCNIRIKELPDRPDVQARTTMGRAADDKRLAEELPETFDDSVQDGPEDYEDDREAIQERKDRSVPKDIHIHTMFWNTDGGYAIPWNDRMKYLVSQARKEARSIELQRKLDEERANRESESESESEDASKDDSKDPQTVPLPGLTRTGQPQMQRPASQGQLQRPHHGTFASTAQPQTQRPASQGQMRPPTHGTLGSTGQLEIQRSSPQGQMRPPIHATSSGTGQPQMQRPPSQGQMRPPTQGTISRTSSSNTLDKGPHSVGSAGCSRALRTSPSKILDQMPHSVGDAGGTPSRTRRRSTGIALDLKQKPAGDSWKPGVALEKALEYSKLIGEGKIIVTQHRRRAFAPAGAWQ